MTILNLGMKLNDIVADLLLMLSSYDKFSLYALYAGM
jgi:hypothetical protein